MPLTYIKHYSSCGPCALGNVDGAVVQWVGDHGEDFGGKPDWVAVGVGGFLGSSGILRERGTRILLVGLDQKLQRENMSTSSGRNGRGRLTWP